LSPLDGFPEEGADVFEHDGGRGSVETEESLPEGDAFGGAVGMMEPEVASGAGGFGGGVGHDPLPGGGKPGGGDEGGDDKGNQSVGDEEEIVEEGAFEETASGRGEALGDPDAR